jgi:hypothetical protein
MRSLLTLLRVLRAVLFSEGRPSSARGPVVTIVCALAAMLALGASSPAGAIETHVFSSSFGGAGSSAGQMSSPSGVAVNTVTHDVYVADTGNLRIDEFSSTGTFIRAWGWGVADGLPAFETCTLICQAGISGSGPGQFIKPAFIAVDNSTGPSAGDIYVGDTGSGLISKFDASGHLISGWGVDGQFDGSTAPHGPFKFVQGIAVDSFGTLYVADGTGRTFEFAQDDSYVTGFVFARNPSPSPEGIAIDPAGNIFRSNSNLGVEEFTAANIAIGEVSTFGEVDTTGLTVDQSDGDLYIDGQTKILHYVFAGADEVREAGGITCSFDVSSRGCPPTDSFGGGELSQGVGVAIDSGRVYVADATGDHIDIFTPATLADVTTEAPTPIAKTTAVLHGTVNPVGIEVTSCRFEWGTQAGSYTNSIPCSPAPGSGNASVPVSAELSGLTANTIYHYRVGAANASGANKGRDESFTTIPAVDALSTGPAEDLAQTSAKLTGSLSPDGSDTHYYFEYGTSTSYGSSNPVLPGTDAGSAGENVPAETTLTGLTANTLYHYRLVGANSFGLTLGQDATFTTAGPPRIDSESSEVKLSEKVGQTSATLRAQINPEDRETTYQFEYGQTASYGTKIPIPASAVGSGQEPASAAVELTGLDIGATYHYRVIATNEYGAIEGSDQTFSTLPPVLIDDESTSSVTSGSATLSAQINPLGSDTTAYFQYGPVNCGPSSCIDLPLAPGGDLGSAESDQSFAVHLQGLTPSTTYQYRIVAVNSTGPPVEGVEHTFTTQAVGSEFTQSDGRAWEMVSPPNKQGAGIYALGYYEGGDTQAAADGSGITYVATGPFVPNPAGNKTIELTQVISTRRGPGSWETADIDTPNERVNGFLAGHPEEYKLFSSDLSLGILEPPGAESLPPLPSGSEKTIYFREAGEGYRALVSTENVPPGTEFGSANLTFVSATPDFSHVILQSRVQLTSTSAPSGGLYEWTGGQLRLASILPDGESTPAALGDGGQLVRNAVSDDGSRLIWGTGFEDNRRLYMRDMMSKEAVQVNAPQGVTEPTQVNAFYGTASSDDSRIFFTSSNRLTVGSTAREISGGAEDLYEYEVTSGPGASLAGKLTDLTADDNAGETADVRGVIGANKDGTDVYFVAAGLLGDAAEHGARPGFNLYLDQYNSAKKEWMSPRFVAALSSADAPTWGRTKNNRNLMEMTSKVSPNGRYLAFMSEQDLTGYENRDVNSGALDEEVFLYDASTNKVVCASCNPTGARPTGKLGSLGFNRNLADYSGNWENRWLAANIPGWTVKELNISLYQSRYLSDSGRLFFNSYDALAPADVNGNGDVYEYEPAGVGSCQGSDHGQSASIVFEENTSGCVSLISAGTSSEESAFMDASETGSDVFFLTLSRLSPQDYDNSIDLYDAHECTPGSPCAPATISSPPPCTTGDACKSAPTPQPALFGTPSSATFSGAGNVVPSTSTPSVKPRGLTRAEKLATALKVCRKKAKGKRAVCERQAKKRFGAKSARVAMSLSRGTRRSGGR